MRHFDNCLIEKAKFIRPEAFWSWSYNFLHVVFSVLFLSCDMRYAVFVKFQLKNLNTEWHQKKNGNLETISVLSRKKAYFGTFRI